MDFKDYKTERREGKKWLFWGIGILFVLGLTLHFLGVFTTVATAPGRVLTKTLGTDNIIQSYEWFYDVDAAYKARMGQVTEFTSLLSEVDGGEATRVRIELGAMRQTCRDLATKYNANSEKMNKAIFKGWSLPETLSMENCNG